MAARAALLLLALFGRALADYSNYDSLWLKPVGSDLAFKVTNGAGTVTYFSVDAAGVAVAAGAITGDDVNATDDVTAGDDVVAGGMVTSAEKIQIDKGGYGHPSANRSLRRGGQRNYEDRHGQQCPCGLRSGVAGFGGFG